MARTAQAAPEGGKTGAGVGNTAGSDEGSEKERATFSRSAVLIFIHFPCNALLMAARKMYPERCISVSDSSGSISIDAMHG